MQLITILTNLVMLLLLYSHSSSVEKALEFNRHEAYSRFNMAKQAFKIEPYQFQVEDLKIVVEAAKEEIIIALEAVAEKVAKPEPQKQETQPEKSDAQAPSSESEQETQPKLTLQNFFLRSVTGDEIEIFHVS